MDKKDKIMRQKRYGQYFSGGKVANLLVSLLPKDCSIRTAIDPMAGIGDMLSALKNRDLGIEYMAGIEIDKLIIDECRSKHPYAEIICGDAFSVPFFKMSRGWDLVITNPPYIRYQLLNNTDDMKGLPSSEQVRENLIEFIQENKNLNNRDRKLFIKLAKTYSGLADIAVPSWILCASMVNYGGLLAMVVPDTWLNREYATPIQYMLLKCFDIITIVSDANSSWFENVQVKTSLIVAKRKDTVSLKDSLKAQTFCIKLGKALIGNTSLIDNFYYDNTYGPTAFEKMLQERKEINSCDYCTSLEKTHTLFSGLFDSNTFLGEKIDISRYDKIPVELRKVLPLNHCVSFTTLSDKGWGIGQGLRTGANDFFYGTVVKQTSKSTVLQVNWNHKNVTIENKNLLYALQNRSEIKGLCVFPHQLTKRLLYITNQVRKSDYLKLNPMIAKDFSLLLPDTENYITEGEKFEPSTGKSLKPFPERSAIRTNEHKNENGYNQFWYMLPKVTHRHVANLCISRVCSRTAECLFVAQDDNIQISIDANFITLWNKSIAEQKVAFALLNSTWFKCYMEYTSTVMGGGALKIEASHIRKVLFPVYTEEQLKALEEIGGVLFELNSMSPQIQNEIDQLVLAPFGEYARDVLNKLTELTNRHLLERGVIV